MQRQTSRKMYEHYVAKYVRNHGLFSHLAQDVLDGAAVERGDAVLQQRAQQDDAGDGRQLPALRAPAEQRPQHRLHSAGELLARCCCKDAASRQILAACI